MSVPASAAELRIHCGNCVYFQEATPTAQTGTCRFHAPRPSGEYHRAVWPEVNRVMDWCADAAKLMAIPVQEAAPKQMGASTKS